MCMGRLILTTGSGHYAAAATDADIEGAIARCREFQCGMRMESESEYWIEAIPAGDLFRLVRGAGASSLRQASGYDVGAETVRVVMELFLAGDPQLEVVVRWEDV